MPLSTSSPVISMREGYLAADVSGRGIQPPEILSQVLTVDIQFNSSLFEKKIVRTSAGEPADDNGVAALDARHLARLLWKPVTSFDDLGCLETSS